MTSLDEIQSMMLLNSLPALNAARILALVDHFGSAGAAVSAFPGGWRQAAGCQEWDFHNIERDWKAALQSSELEIRLLKERGYSVCLISDGRYPALLKEIPAPPPIIYIRGETWDFSRIAVALVGSRRASYYGDRVARKLAGELADRGIVTVSGLAKGIDRAVHESSILSGEETWAVLGSGLNCLYPTDHEPLAKKIEKNGAVISEFPLESQPFPGNFPRRNRIISGLSRVTVVVEGSEKSGSLITARLAANQGRDVLAVPGPITSPTSWAPNRLIQEGAKPVLKVDDIIEELKDYLPKDMKSTNDGVPVDLQQTAREFLDLLSSTPVPKQWMMDKLSLDPDECSRLILELELMGLIQGLPGGMLIRKS